MSAEIISFTQHRKQTIRAQRTPERKSMRSLSFRSRDVLLKVDEATLIEDIRSESEKAARKLEALQEHRKSYIERTALEIERLTAAEAKFGAAVRRLSNPTSLQWFGRCRHPIRRGSGKWSAKLSRSASNEAPTAITPEA